MYIGETFAKTISNVVHSAKVPVYKLSLDFFAMFITGTAISATTTGRIPLKIFITVGLS